MANKSFGRILSGGAIVSCVILLCTLNISGQTFTPRKIQFTISGSVGLSGVRMTGLPGNPVSDENGFYSAAIDYGWTGKVVPIMEGYTFDPPDRTYNNVKSNLENQNYTAELIKFIISGSAGQPGVVMNGLPGNPVSGIDGTYTTVVEYGWTGTVRPEKEGYTFTPATKPYTQVKRDYTSESYTAAEITFTISGSVVESGVMMKGLPKMTISGPGGTYSAVVPYAWSGVVAPEKQGFTFNPSSRPYSNLIGAQTNQDYTAEPITYTISGTVGQGGVVMKGLPGEPVTGSDGTYMAVVGHGFTGKVTPVKEGYIFKPPSMTYSNVTDNLDNQAYVAEVLTYSISGSVGQEGVTMAGLPGNPVSSTGGNYKVTVDHGWSGTVMPQREGFTFSPDYRTYPRVVGDQTNQNYTASRITFTISGTTGVGGVVMQGLPGRVVTDNNGRYTATVEYNWSGIVAPEKEGYTFTPATRQYSGLISAETNQDYTPALLKRAISGKIVSAQGPLAGVLVSADSGGGSATTDTNGEYQLSVDHGWTGAVTPTIEGYNFKPAERKYPRVTSDQTSQDYTAEVVMLTISGKLPSPVEGVVMSTSPGGIPGSTDANGNWSVKVPYGWSGEISPQKEGFVFDPPSQPYSNVTTNYKDGVAAAPPQPPRPPIPIPPIPIPPTPPGPIVPPKPPEDETIFDIPPTVPIVDTNDVEGQFEAQRRALEQQIENLRKQMDELLGQLYGGAVGPDFPPLPDANIPFVIDANVVRPIGPRVPTIPGKIYITYFCVNKDLRQVLQEISLQAGVKIYPDDTVKGTVSCQIRDEPLAKALQMVLSGTGYAVKEIPDSYLVYTPISNVWVDAELRSALQDIATDAGVAIIPDETVTGLVSADIKDVPLETALDIVLAGTGYVVTKNPYYYLISSAAVDSKAFPAISETRRLKLNYVGADVAVQLLSSAFRPYVQAETGTHMVLITAPPVLLNRIVADFNQVDRPPRHVMLDARIVVMERGDLLNLGVEWGWPRIGLGIFGSDFKGGGDPDTQFHGKWPWGVQIGYTPDATFTDSLLLTLNLLSQNGEADIVSSPQVMAQDGREARLSVINEEHFFLTAQQAAATFFTEAELQTVESGTVLTITPRISDNNEITLAISTEVSDVVARGQQTEEVLPLVTVTRRTATNTVRVRDGGTVALAGLTENRTFIEEKRTPGLSRIPILGALFSNTRNQTASREVAIFITARLVPDVEGLVGLVEPSPPPVPARLPEVALQKEVGTPVPARGPTPAPAYAPAPAPVPGPIEQMGDEEFRMRLRESLSRPIR